MSTVFRAPNIFKSQFVPASNLDIGDLSDLGDLWIDLSVPALKRKTGNNPDVWVSVEGGGVAINFQDNETPAGLVNGVNTTFTLAFAPTPAGSLLLFRNGLLQLAGGTDYTLAGATVTMVTAPLTGDLLRCWYRR